MSCKQWNDEWVAHLYGELEPTEARRLTAHIESCAECRATFGGLRSSRELLAAAAPAVPSTPRVVVLRPRPIWSNAWTFAAGAACALILFGAGFVSGPRFMGNGQPDGSLTADNEPVRQEITTQPAVDDSDSTEALRDELLAMQQRLDRLEGTTAPPEGMTAAEFQKELARVERRFNNERLRDLEYVVRSLTASEVRTGTWMDQTHEALTMLAMRQDGGFEER